MLASVQQNAGDRFLFNARDPFDAADAVTLKQKHENHQRLFFGQVHIAEKRIAFFLESALALVTAKPLIAFAVFAGFLRFDFAVVAGHYEP